MPSELNGVNFRTLLWVIIAKILMKEKSCNTKKCRVSQLVYKSFSCVCTGSPLPLSLKTVF